VVVQIEKSPQRKAVNVDGAMRFACRGVVRTGRKQWAAQTRIEIFNQTRRRFNGSITLSIIDEISCAARETRAFIGQSRRRQDIRRRSWSILPGAFARAAAHALERCVHCTQVREFAC
jgi:hypothetical protein